MGNKYTKYPEDEKLEQEFVTNIKNFINEDKTSLNYLTDLRKDNINKNRKTKPTINKKSNFKEIINTKGLNELTLEIISSLTTTSINHEINSTLYKAVTIPKISDNNISSVNAFDLELLGNQSALLIDWIYKTFLVEKIAKFDQWVPLPEKLDNVHFVNLEEHYSSIQKDEDDEDEEYSAMNLGNMSLEKVMSLTKQGNKKLQIKPVKNKKKLGENYNNNKNKDVNSSNNLFKKNVSIPKQSVSTNTVIGNNANNISPHISMKKNKIKSNKIVNIDNNGKEEKHFDQKTVNSILNVLNKVPHENNLKSNKIDNKLENKENLLNENNHTIKTEKITDKEIKSIKIENYSAETKGENIPLNVIEENKNSNPNSSIINKNKIMHLPTFKQLENKNNNNNNNFNNEEIVNFSNINITNANNLQNSNLPVNVNDKNKSVIKLISEKEVNTKFKSNNSKNIINTNSHKNTITEKENIKVDGIKSRSRSRSKNKSPSISNNQQRLGSSNSNTQTLSNKIGFNKNLNQNKNSIHTQNNNNSKKEKTKITTDKKEKEISETEKNFADLILQSVSPLKQRFKKDTNAKMEPLNIQTTDEEYFSNEENNNNNNLQLKGTQKIKNKNDLKSLTKTKNNLIPKKTDINKLKSKSKFNTLGNRKNYNGLFEYEQNNLNTNANAEKEKKAKEKEKKAKENKINKNHIRIDVRNLLDDLEFDKNDSSKSSTTLICQVNGSKSNTREFTPIQIKSGFRTVANSNKFLPELERNDTKKITPTFHTRQQ